MSLSDHANGHRPGTARPARIGYVVKVYPRFSETFILREILAREAAGEDIAIASLRPTSDGRFHDLLARVKAPVSWIAHDQRSASRLWQSLCGLDELPGAATGLPPLLREEHDVAGQAVALARWAVEQGITHLHAHFASLPGRTTRLAAQLAALTYSVTAHAKDLFHEDVDALRLGAVLADAHHVVTVSDHNVAWIGERFPAAADRVHRVYNGVDLDELPWSSPAVRPRRIVAVGRLVEKKGFADLIDAVALLHQRGAPAQLSLAGSGPCAAALASQVDALGLGDHVDLLGDVPQHDVLRLLEGGAAFAAPCVVADDGDRDGLPTVIVEAMALGTPCVSTPVTGIGEIVRDGATGLLVPERDPFALADALERLLADGELREQLSCAARVLVESSFDVRGQAEALRRLDPHAPAPAPLQAGIRT